MYNIKSLRILFNILKYTKPIFYSTLSLYGGPFNVIPSRQMGLSGCDPMTLNNIELVAVYVFFFFYMYIHVCIMVSYNIARCAFIYMFEILFTTYYIHVYYIYVMCICMYIYKHLTLKRISVIFTSKPTVLPLNNTLSHPAIIIVVIIFLSVSFTKK